MRTISTFIIFLLFSASLFAQNKINGSISNYNNSIIFLTDFYGDDHHIVDSTRTDSKGVFLFTIKENLPKGLYRLYFGQSKFFDLILNHQDVELSTTLFSPKENIKIIESEENRLLYQYLRDKEEFQLKSELVKTILEYYPPNDNYYNESLNQFVELNNDFVNMAIKEVAGFKKLFVYQYIHSDLIPLIKYSPTYEEINKQFKESFLDNINFSDINLLHSNIFSSKTIQYLELYKTDGISDIQLENNYKIAIDSLLTKSKKTPRVYNYILSFLFNGFEQNNYDELIRYLASNYKPIDIDNSSNYNTLSEKISTINQLQPGNLAPEFKADDINGKEITLYKVKSKYTLLVFWSADCPSCQKVLPIIRQDIYNKYKSNKISIIGISTDDNKNLALQEIKENNYSWTNIVTGNGLDDNIIRRYNINSTPIIYLLDKKKRILSQINSINEIQIYLNQ
ncbi:MAG: peroxiredoxin family protein [Hyphomicrobiales bacterium]